MELPPHGCEKWEDSCYAMLLGLPCETWSSTRFEQQLDEDGRLEDRGRLGGQLECWGVPGLTLVELRSCQLAIVCC